MLNISLCANHISMFYSIKQALRKIAFEVSVALKITFNFEQNRWDWSTTDGTTLGPPGMEMAGG